MLVSNRDHSPIHPNDPLYVPKQVAWRVLQDAVCKSCMSNDLYSKRSKPATSKCMVSYFSEARQWIMDMGDDAPGTNIGDGMISGFTCGFCLEVLDIDRKSFVDYIRSVWESRDPAIKDALKSKLRKEKQVVAEVAHRNKLRKKWGKDPLPLPPARPITHITKALGIARRSEKWHG